MNTFTGPNGTVFHHNSDMSGDVVIALRAGQLHHGERDMVVIPAADFLAFAADYIRRQRISQIEDMTDAQVLGIEKGKWRPAWEL